MIQAIKALLKRHEEALYRRQDTKIHRRICRENSIPNRPVFVSDKPDYVAEAEALIRGRVQNDPREGNEKTEIGGVLGYEDHTDEAQRFQFPDYSPGVVQLTFSPRWLNRHLVGNRSAAVINIPDSRLLVTKKGIIDWHEHAGIDRLLTQEDMKRGSTLTDALAKMSIPYFQVIINPDVDVFTWYQYKKA